MNQILDMADEICQLLHRYLYVVLPNQQIDSQWSSPLCMVPKKNPGEWRPCRDYRLLKSVMNVDRYRIHIESISSKLNNCTLVSEIDLLRVYYKISIEDNDVKKTSITTHF